MSEKSKGTSSNASSTGTGTVQDPQEKETHEELPGTKIPDSPPAGPDPEAVVTDGPAHSQRGVPKPSPMGVASSTGTVQDPQEKETHEELPGTKIPDSPPAGPDPEAVVTDGPAHSQRGVPKPSPMGVASSTGTVQDPQEKETHEELLNQFYATLRVMYLAAQSDVGTAEQHARIRERLSEHPRTWRGAYEIEQLLAFVMTDDQVATELLRCMAEAKALNLEFVAEIKKQFKVAREVVQADDTNDDQRKHSLAAMRYILQRLLNDLQWFYNKRIRRREAAKRLSMRVSALFLSAFFFFFTLLFVQHFSNPVSPDIKVHAGPETSRTTKASE